MKGQHDQGNSEVETYVFFGKPVVLDDILIRKSVVSDDVLLKQTREGTFRCSRHR